ncbi:MAG: agmatinase [Chloroflexota bacterium]|nr:agmatinase [Chloroflexota bacterium]MDE2960551.1 agmatinase [Chloroflexota bacterium]
MPDPERPPVPWTPTNFLALPPEQSSLDTAAAVLIPVPIDSTTSFRTGARHGPAAIITASAALEDYDIELGVDVADFGIHTTPPLEPHVGDPHHMVERVGSAVSHYAAQGSGKLTGVIGGDHSASIGSAFAQLDRYPNLSVLYIDAHADLRDEYQGTRWGHGSGARRIAERCPISLIGVRNLALEERQYIDARRIPVCYWPPGNAGELDDIIAGLPSDVYISVDLDVLDPAEMPAVGTPEPGGMRWLELTGILRRVCQERHVVGFDVCELAPDQGLPAHSYVAAKLVYKLIAYALGPRWG